MPDSIISKGDELIISKVGEQFFNSYIKYDSEKSRYYEANAYCIEHPPNCAEFLLKPHYLLVYTFKIPEKDFVNEIIEFVTDTVGKVVPSRDQFGIPSCPNNDCREHFPLIGKKEAITIARNNGFDKGLRDWLISFNFYAGDFNNYIWTISNTLYQSEFESGGRTLIIDAANGDILHIYGWIAVP